MLRLFKKKKERPQVEDIKSQSSENESSDFFFNFEYLPEDKKKEKIYLYEWLKKDGEWIDEGQPLYSIRLGEYLGVGTAMVSEPILSKRRGVIQHLKDKDQIIQIGDKVYTIHPKSVYEKENSIQNERFYVYFDKYKNKIPDKYSHHNLRIKQWHKED